LQGALYYPAGYEPGKKYPMVVYMYEKLSDGLHRYSTPSERDYYNPSAITSTDIFCWNRTSFSAAETGRLRRGLRYRRGNKTR